MHFAKNGLWHLTGQGVLDGRSVCIPHGQHYDSGNITTGTHGRLRSTNVYDTGGRWQRFPEPT